METQRKMSKGSECLSIIVIIIIIIIIIIILTHLLHLILLTESSLCDNIDNLLCFFSIAWWICVDFWFLEKLIQEHNLWIRWVIKLQRNDPKQTNKTEINEQAWQFRIPRAFEPPVPHVTQCLWTPGAPCHYEARLYCRDSRSVILVMSQLSVPRGRYIVTRIQKAVRQQTNLQMLSAWRQSRLFRHVGCCCAVGCIPMANGEVTIVRSDNSHRQHSLSAATLWSGYMGGSFFPPPPHLSHFFSSSFRTLIFVLSALLPFSSAADYLHLRSFVLFIIPSLIQSV